ncbi:hypothetical protein [Amycolatopsis sp. FDAARGOS 1241]|uniref:hypothetical protein n=1 Tax=Amycolatopsis sp. FDAARGOS 1241 TaxID=2778070 RepID=UPI00194E402C|nr:hypothetical protein [Amycolatopsis sp. FDAARGOS 1241]QRP48008.1 hypothetical protein I6J71_09025 [Amycolatopsis sp. FDAARGOS 1241]
MEKKKSLTVKVHIDGVREVLRALSVLPKDAQNALRDHSLALARKLALKGAVDLSLNGGPQGPLLATTVKAVRDRVPVVQAGGTRRLGRHAAPAYGMLFGSIFGMNGRSGWYSASRYAGSAGRQYRPHQGRDAYAFFPIIEGSAETISREWHAAVDDVVRKFGGA